MIRIECGCGKILKISDALAGKRIKCPACGAVQVVSAPTGATGAADPNPKAPRKAATTAPRSPVKKPELATSQETLQSKLPRSHDDGDDRERKSRKKKKAKRRSGPPWLLIGSGAGALVLVVAIGLVLFFVFRGDDKIAAVGNRKPAPRADTEIGVPAAEEKKANIPPLQENQANDLPKEKPQLEEKKEVMAEQEAKAADNATKVKPFLDEKKEVPPRLEWNRQITSKIGGAITFKVSSQGPFAVTLITEKAFKALQSGAAINKTDVLLTTDILGTTHEGKATLPAGSCYFIIENQTDKNVVFHLQCFSPN